MLSFFYTRVRDQPPKGNRSSVYSPRPGDKSECSCATLENTHETQSYRFKFLQFMLNMTLISELS